MSSYADESEEQSKALTALTDFKKILKDLSERIETNLLTEELMSNFKGCAPPKTTSIREGKQKSILKLLSDRNHCTICKIQLCANGTHPSSAIHVRKVICLRLYVLTDKPTKESLNEVITLLQIQGQTSKEQKRYYLLMLNSQMWNDKHKKEYDGAKLWFRGLLDSLCCIYEQLTQNSSELERLKKIVDTLLSPHSKVSQSALPV